MDYKELIIFLLLVQTLVTAYPDCQCRLEFGAKIVPCDDQQLSSGQRRLHVLLKNFHTTEIADPLAYCREQYPLLNQSKISLFLTNSSFKTLSIDHELRSLHLSSTNYTELVLDDSEEYKLEGIVLDNVPFYEFPKNFNKLVNLEFFVGDVRVPVLEMSQFSGMSQLSSITIVQSCSSWMIGSGLELPRLEAFNFDANGLEFVPDGLSSLKSLEYLNMRSNNISYLDMDKFSGMTSLKYLNLNGNPLKEIYSTFTINLPALQALDFSQEQLYRLDVTLWKMPNLQELKLNGIHPSNIIGLEDRFSKDLILYTRGYKWFNIAYVNVKRIQVGDE